MKASRRFFVIIVMIALAAGASLAAQDPMPEVSQKDIDSFLGFADDYIANSAKFLPGKEGLTVSDCFYSDNMKLMSATESFLKKKKWNFEKMNDFLFTVGMAMEALAYYEEYGYPEEVGTEPEDDPFNDIPRSAIALAKTNRAKLLKYFPPMELDMEGGDEPPQEGDDGDGALEAPVDGDEDIEAGDEAPATGPLPPGPPVPPRS